MELQELSEIFSNWRNYGLLTATNRERLKDEYFRLTGLPKITCTTCNTFWLTVKTTLYTHLKQNDILMEKKPGKYKLLNDEPLMVPFQSVQFVAEGENFGMNKLIGDPANVELIEAVLKEYPELKSVILEVKEKEEKPK